jgi:hypothetical protein
MDSNIRIIEKENGKRLGVAGGKLPHRYFR